MTLSHLGRLSDDRHPLQVRGKVEAPDRAPTVGIFGDAVKGSKSDSECERNHA